MTLAELKMFELGLHNNQPKSMLPEGLLVCISVCIFYLLTNEPILMTPQYCSSGCPFKDNRILMERILKTLFVFLSDYPLCYQLFADL